MKNKIILAALLAFAAAAAYADLTIPSNTNPTTPVTPCTIGDPKCSPIGPDLNLGGGDTVNEQPFTNDGYKNCRCNLTAPGVDLNYCCQYKAGTAKVWTGGAWTDGLTFCKTPCSNVTCSAGATKNGQAYMENTGSCCNTVVCYATQVISTISGGSWSGGTESFSQYKYVSGFECKDSGGNACNTCPELALNGASQEMRCTNEVLQYMPDCCDYSCIYDWAPGYTSCKNHPTSPECLSPNAMAQICYNWLGNRCVTLI